MCTRLVCMWLSCSFLVLACGSVRAADKPAAKPPEVPFVRPIAREVADYENFAGRIEAVNRVDLRARVSGYLRKAPFREGNEVKEGDLLFEIDARPYQAELDRVQAAVKLSEADLKLAEAVLQQTKALFAQKTISRADVDKAVTEQSRAEAGVHAARASLEAVRLTLDFTRVRSPIAGRIGRRLLDPGNLVKADESILATVVSRDPMYVYFDVDERSILRLRQSTREAKAKAEKIAVAVGLSGEASFPHRGVVDFTDNQVNAETGTVHVRALLPNKDDVLMPGQFVRVRLPMGAPYKSLLVPSEAVLTEDGKRFVYVVNDKSAIERRTVAIGREQDGLRVVNDGLRPDDRVVVGRQQKLQPGMIVRPVEGGTPPAAAPAKSGADARPVHGEPGPVILVEAEYAGANATVVAATVAASIEQQICGVEKALSLRSRCTDDGKYLLAVNFALGAHPKISQVLVQNRVNLALPLLPDGVKLTGVTTRERMPGVQAFVTLFSPGGTYDSFYLSNYARIQIKDELTRLRGVADLTIVGQREYALRVLLDPERLAARNLSAAEVVRALENQNVQATPGQTPKGKGRQTAIAVNPLGRQIEAEALEEIILKTEAEDRVVRLKDVARIELGVGGSQGRASMDGKPAVALAVHTLWDARPRELSAAVQGRIAELRSRLPRDLVLDVTFDFTAEIETPNRPTAPEYLLLDLDLPAGLSVERVQKMLGRCDAQLRQVQGVQHTLTLSDNPFDLFASGPCMLVALEPAKTRRVRRGEIVQEIRTRLDEIKEMTLRLRDLSGPGRFPRCAYPIDLAVCGSEAVPVRDFARKLAERLGGCPELLDVAVSADSLPRPQLVVDIDQTQAADRGVTADDISKTLRVYIGSLYVNDFNRFGRTWRVQVQVKADADELVKAIKNLKIRNAHGQMVPLGVLATVRMSDGPRALEFLDSRPMVEITANLAADARPAAVHSRCEKLAEEVRKELRLPTSYGLSWLLEIPKTK